MAKGRVSWINPPENKGKITRTDNGSNKEYEYNVAAGDTVNGYLPRLNDPVNFVADDSSSRATSVQPDKLSIISFVYDGSNLTWETTGGATSGIIDKIGDVQVPNGTYPAGRETPPFVLTISDSVNSVSRENTNA